MISVIRIAYTNCIEYINIMYVQQTCAILAVSDCIIELILRSYLIDNTLYIFVSQVHFVYLVRLYSMRTITQT